MKIIQRSLSFAIHFFILHIFSFDGELSPPVVVCFLINCLSKEEQVLVLSFFDYSVIPESIHLSYFEILQSLCCQIFYFCYLAKFYYKKV